MTQDPEAARLILGTAQFGLDYGVTNDAGRVAPTMVEAILETAKSAGVSRLDSAEAYGAAHETLGASQAARDFAVITKISVTDGDAGRLDRALDQVLSTLSRDRVDGLLIHNPGTWSDAAVAPVAAKWLQRVRAEGRVGRVGVSVYDPEDLVAAERYLEPEIVQGPMNLLDQRFAHSGVLERLKSGGAEFHARSVFLQGMLLAEADAVPPNLAAFAPILGTLDAQSRDTGLTRQALCLSAVWSHRDVARVVIGVTSDQEMRALLAALAMLQSVEAVRTTADFAAKVPNWLIDPRRWPSIAS